jgi:hypothetical protein
MITITADELDRIITEKYPEASIDITNDLFPEGYSNDCYKTLYITDDCLAEELGPHYVYLFETLCEAFPGQDTILVDLSW